MRIGFYFNGSHCIDFSHERFLQGEIGISGTDSSFFRVIDAFVSHGHEVHLFSMGLSEYPGVIFHQVSMETDILHKHTERTFDAFVFIVRDISTGLEEFLRRADNHRVKLIAWAQNPITPDILNLFYHTEAIRRIVFVEAWHLHHIRHLAAFNKATVIPNGIPVEEYIQKSAFYQKKDFAVTFIGSLTPAKGFHIMAAAWQYILKIVPDAQLYIAGDAKLYNKQHTGNTGYFHEGYGQYIEGYLGASVPEQERNHVHFLGLLTRNQVIEQMAVSKLVCINPNTKDALECCSVSSLEAQACGAPIVAGGAGGNLLTIANNKTGLLTDGSVKSLANNIIKLLKDTALNQRMQQAGPKYVTAKYHIKDVYSTWEQTISDVIRDIAPSQCPIPVSLLSAKLIAKEALRIKRKILG